MLGRVDVRDKADVAGELEIGGVLGTGDEVAFRRLACGGLEEQFF